MNPFKMLKSLFTSVPRLAPRECGPRVRGGEALLIDVREPGEWTSGIAQHAVMLSFSDLTGGRAQWKPFLADQAGKELLLYCASGGRSGMAARILAARVFARRIPADLATGSPPVGRSSNQASHAPDPAPPQHRPVLLPSARHVLLPFRLPAPGARGTRSSIADSDG